MRAIQTTLLFDDAEIRATQNQERQARFKEFWRSAPNTTAHLRKFYARWAEFGRFRDLHGHDQAVRLFERWREEDRRIAP
jgi:hypothetical protein